MEGGGLSDALLGNGEFITNRAVAAERSNAENTIWGKVVASPESGPW